MKFSRQNYMRCVLLVSKSEVAANSPTSWFHFHYLLHCLLVSCLWPGSKSSEKRETELLDLPGQRHHRGHRPGEPSAVSLSPVDRRHSEKAREVHCQEQERMWNAGT